MRLNSILVASAATAALLGGLSVSTYAFAQYAGNPPQYSSPAEKAQTQQLNEQSVNGTTESPTVLNGEAPDNSAPQPAPSANGYYGGNDDQNQPQSPSAQQQQYNQQLQQYQDQQQQYQDQQGQYRNQKNHYEHELRWYDQTRWSYDYPHAYAYEFDGSGPALVRLDRIAEPSQQLAEVPIEGPNGVWVGRIRNVEIGPDGTPARVEVALNRRVSVWVNPRRLRFDPSERVAFTNLSREDLWQMPGATVESAPM